ncbi:hypothetical protein [Acuticoccus sp.]
MIGRDTREDMDRYGLAPWILGLVLAGGLSYVMFVFALPIGR